MRMMSNAKNKLIVEVDDVPFAHFEFVRVKKGKVAVGPVAPPAPVVHNKFVFHLADQGEIFLYLRFAWRRGVLFVFGAGLKNFACDAVDCLCVGNFARRCPPHLFAFVMINRQC